MNANILSGLVRFGSVSAGTISAVTDPARNIYCTNTNDGDESDDDLPIQGRFGSQRRKKRFR